jgi:hypothetical protein
MFTIKTVLDDETRTWAQSLHPTTLSNITSLMLAAVRKSILSESADIKDAPYQCDIQTGLASAALLPGPAYMSNTAPITSAAKIGLEGEREVEEIMSRYQILNTAKSGKCADLIIVVEGIKILIEVKKYKSSVPSAEVEKFYRDIEANVTVDAGMMVSLTSRITGYHSSINRITGKSVPIILNCLHSMDKNTWTDVLHASVEVLCAEVTGKRSYVDIGDKITLAVADITSSVDLISQCRNTVHETNNVISKQMNHLMKNILEAEISIKTSIKMIQGQIQEQKVKPCTIDYSKIPIKYQNLLKVVISNLMLKNVSILANDKYTLIVAKHISCNTPKNSNCATIKLYKSKAVCIFDIALHEAYTYISKLPSGWNGVSYSKKILSIDLEPQSLQIIIELINII